MCTGGGCMQVAEDAPHPHVIHMHPGAGACREAALGVGTHAMLHICACMHGNCSVGTTRSPAWCQQEPRWADTGGRACPGNGSAALATLESRLSAVRRTVVSRYLGSVRRGVLACARAWHSGVCVSWAESRVVPCSLPRIRGSGSRDVAGGDSRGRFDIIRQLKLIDSQPPRRRPPPPTRPRCPLALARGPRCHHPHCHNAPQRVMARKRNE